MVTTIQVHEDTVVQLNELKKEMRIKSYEEVIKRLIKIKKSLKKSYFGKLPDLEPFEREEIDRFS